MTAPLDLAALQERLRDDLIANGWILPTRAMGLRGLGDPAERVIEALGTVIDRSASVVHRDDELTRLRFPPVSPRELLVQADYAASFPQLIGAVSVFRGGDREHRAFLAAAERDDWTDHLTPSEFALTPAACHPVYAHLAGSTAGGLRFQVTGDCFRNEPSDDPMRRVSFRMREYVAIGSSDETLAHRDAWIARAIHIFESIGLEVSSDAANDPFFGRAGAVLASGQRESALKIEILAEAYPGHPTAIASGNYHQDHFGEKFGILLATGEVAHSACFGFGLERIAFALAAHHGSDLSAWPAPVRSVLGL